MKLNRYIHIIVLLCINFQLKAQQADKISANPVFTADYIVGAFQHKDGERGRVMSHFVSFSALLKTGLNENSFFVDYGKPHIGVSALGGGFSNRTVYGSLWSLYPTWQFEFFPDKQVGWNIKLGTGLVYFSRHYDKFDNTTNFLIGSKINNITEIATNAWIALAPQLQLQTGVSFYHFSNAHVRIPNLGLNYAAIRMGLIYKPGEFSKFSAKPRIIIPSDSSNSLHKQLEFSFGRHELAYSTFPVDGPSYSIFKLGCYATKRIRYIHEVRAGVVAVFYNSYFTQMKFERAEGFKFLRATQTKLIVGHEFLMHRFGFVTDIGITITDPFYRQKILNTTSFGDQWFYSYLSTRLGLKCYVLRNSFSTKKIAVGMFLNTHGTTADYLDFSASFGW